MTKPKTNLNTNQKQNIIALKKISSLSLKIIEMIERDESCYAILQQLQALMGLVKKSQSRTMQCSIEQVLDFDDAVDKQKIKDLNEIVQSLSLFNK
jgi:DNA-binding FrmR family transcriptional regulator